MLYLVYEILLFGYRNASHYEMKSDKKRTSINMDFNTKLLAILTIVCLLGSLNGRYLLVEIKGILNIFNVSKSGIKMSNRFLFDFILNQFH